MSLTQNSEKRTSTNVIDLAARRPSARRHSKMQQRFGGISSWHRTPGVRPEVGREVWDPMANDEAGAYRSAPFTGVELRRLDIWRAERERKILRLIKKVQEAVHEIRLIDPIKHGVAYDPLVAYVALMANVHYVLFNIDLGPAGRSCVLDMARETLFNAKAAMEAHAAHIAETAP